MSMIADARATVGHALEQLPDVDVSPFPATPEQLRQPRIVIAVRDVVPPDTACPYVRVNVDVWTVAHVTDPGPADDVVDRLCSDALDALEAAGIPWSTAERGVWADTFPCYRIATEVRTG